MATKYPIHPACQAAPGMSPKRYKLLVEDIAAYGVIHPITLHHGQVLDGRHRLRACEELGLEEPEYVTDDELLEHNGDAWAFVRSQLIVKDYTTGQLSMFAADEKKAKGLDVQAKERQSEAGGDRKSAKAKKSLRDTSPEAKGRARELAGAAFGVSGRKKKGCDTCHNLKGRSSDQAAANNKGNQPC